jgi:hypothetical protein
MSETTVAWTGGSRCATSDPLRYEKAMLDDRFRARLVERRGPPA